MTVTGPCEASIYADTAPTAAGPVPITTTGNVFFNIPGAFRVELGDRYYTIQSMLDADSTHSHRLKRHPDGPESAEHGQLPSVSVIIPVYTMDRWGLLTEAVASVLHQSVAVRELIIAVDQNLELYERCQRNWDNGSVLVVLHQEEPDTAARSAHARVHGSRRRFGAGAARNQALPAVTGDIVAFLDDDAAANPDWLLGLLVPYGDPGVVAVGGAPLPRYATQRPGWFPAEFDWVFGCAYEGLPTERGPVRHLIGANMSARTALVGAVGGFHSIDFDDMDLCHRLAAFGSILYEPAAIVRHFVPAERVTWRYFWRRCFFVNMHKVEAFRDLGDDANLASERAFISRFVTRSLPNYLGAAVRGDGAAVVRLLVSLCGISLSGLGNFAGRLRLARRAAPSSVPSPDGRRLPV
jgi:glycosyltransferase involved in cell wall biosynthesis